jgi:hypothetical protein
MTTQLDFLLGRLREVIKDIEEKRANNFSIESLNLIQHILINMSNKSHAVPPLAVADIKWREKQINIFNIFYYCCKRI